MSDTMSAVLTLVTALANLGAVVIVVKMIVITSQISRETKEHTEAMARRLAEIDRRNRVR